MSNLINKEETERSKSEKIEEIPKDYTYKICYKIRLNNEKEYLKHLKLDENNECNNGMTKPLPTGYIKQCSDISLRTFNLLLEKMSLNDQIGHLYVVDIEFDQTKATKRQIVYNEIYAPIIEKQKIINLCETSVY